MLDLERLCLAGGFTGNTAGRSIGDTGWLAPVSVLASTREATGITLQPLRGAHCLSCFAGFLSPLSVVLLCVSCKGKGTAEGTTVVVPLFGDAAPVAILAVEPRRGDLDGKHAIASSTLVSRNITESSSV